MKQLLFVLSILYLNVSFGQTEAFELLERPIYIVNEQYVVYQDAHRREIIYPHMESFEIVSSRGHNCSAFAFDKNGIYFEGELLKLDTAGFKIVGRNNTSPTEWLWKTNTAVFNNAKQLHGIDPTTFTYLRCLNGGYFKDKNSVYFFDQKIKGSDGGTVNETCDFQLCHDQNQVYLDGEIMTFQGEVVRPINEYLFKTKSVVIDRNSTVISAADPETITALSKSFAIDKSHLFFQTDTVVTPPNNLENIRIWEQVNHVYYTDGKSVYAGYGILQDLDAQTFGMLPNSDVFYDKNGCYQRKWNAEALKGFNEKFAFNYDGLLNPNDLSSTDYYLVYRNQVYSRHLKKIHSNLSDQEMLRIQNDRLLAQDSAELSRPSYVDDRTYFPSTSFVLFESKLLFGDEELISAQNLELLAIFSGYRRGCGSDPKGATNHYFFRNDEGYWMIETTDLIEPVFLGKEFDPKWNPVFAVFEMPKKVSRKKE